MFEQLIQVIQRHDTIILHRHTNPDGDALGSQLGLKHLILDNFPGKTVYAVGDGAGRYGFMADSVMDEISDAAYENALAVILDCGARHLISDDRYTLAGELARIDHHVFCEQIAPVEVIDHTSESCCGLVADMAMECGWNVSLTAATLLYTGMVTDSGRFRYDATNARTFQRAAFLMQQPIDFNELYRCLYAADFEQMKLRAQFTLKIQFTPRNVAYIYTTREEMEQLNADTFTISRGMVNVMADIKGVDSWVNFTETDKGVLCELRSGKYNINPIAARHGGGGHAKASGATLRDRQEALEVLAELDELTGENP